jgi:hypothetical protein
LTTQRPRPAGWCIAGNGMLPERPIRILDPGATLAVRRPR